MALRCIFKRYKLILNGYRMNAMKERRNNNEKNIKSTGRMFLTLMLFCLLPAAGEVIN